MAGRSRAHIVVSARAEQFAEVEAKDIAELQRAGRAVSTPLGDLSTVSQ